jgi:hypothetical protein
LVEQLIRNQQVTGSSPVNGSSSKVSEAPDPLRGFLFFRTLRTAGP